MGRAQQAADLLARGWSVGKIAEYWKVEKDSVRRYLSSAKQYGLKSAQVVVESRPAPPKKPEDVWTEMEVATSNHLAESDTKNKARIRIDTDKPVGIAFIGDQHIGGMGVDMAAMRRDAEIIAATPNMFAILGGDLLDNFILRKMAHVSRDNRFSIEEQQRAALHYLDTLGPSLLAVTGGNHEAWTQKESGVDILARLVDQCGQENLLYDPHRWRIELALGDYEYGIGIQHKAKGNSEINPTLGPKKALFLGVFDASTHVSVAFHTHTPSIETIHWGENGRRLAIKGSTYKMRDVFGLEHGFPATASWIPSAFFWPDRFHYEGQVDVENAAGYLSYLQMEDRRA